jgi:superfamily II DNA or RNA helicase
MTLDPLADMLDHLEPPRPATRLHPYQEQVVDELDRLVEQGERKILLVAPTGSGKTVIASAIIKGKPRRVLFIAHRREIVNQTSAKLAAFGVPHGIIMAGAEKKLRPMASVQVASVQTLHARAIRSTSTPMPPADLLVIDEAHHSCAATYKKVIDSYPDAVLIGLTATPCRGDGRGLGGIFETMVECPQVAELIEGKYLVKTRVYAPVDPDLRGVRTVAGDYVESQLAARMDCDKLVGDLVTHWHKYGERRRTVAFAVSVGHSIHIAEEFVRAGVRAEHLDGQTSIEDRAAILGRLASGETEVVSNCMVLTEGWDMPEVGCCVLARPTKKMGLYRQMIGRALRPADGKADAIVLDHSGAVFRHGLPEDHVDWTLDPDHQATAPAHAKRGSGEHDGGLLECSQCGALRLGGKPCPSCGFMPRRPAEFIATAAGELGLVEGGRAKAAEYDRATRMQWLGMFTFIATQRGYKSGWAKVNYKEKFGSWPPYGITVEPTPPTPECYAWVRSRMIAYAKRRGAA